MPEFRAIGVNDLSGQINASNQNTFAIVFTKPLPLPYKFSVEFLDPSNFNIAIKDYTSLKTANGVTLRTSSNITATIIWQAVKI